MAQTPWQDLIPYYVARSLTAPEMQAFEAQLARDQNLRQEVAEWRRIAAVVWREADTAARHLPPLSPEIYKQLQYRNGAQPASSTMPVPLQQVRRVSMGRMNGSPLMFVAGFIVVFLCGGIMLMSAMRQFQPEVISTNVAANSTDQGFGGPAGPTATPTVTATGCLGPIGNDSPDCLTAKAALTTPDKTWTPIPRGTSTPVVVGPVMTVTPRPTLRITVTPVGMLPQATKNALMSSVTQTAIAAYTVGTVWPNYQCVATNTSGDLLPLYARAEYSEVIEYWSPGLSMPVSASMYGFWVQVAYGKWTPTDGVTLTGPCSDVPAPSPTYSGTGDQCTVTNTTQNAVPLYNSADVQSQIVNYLPMGQTQQISTYSNTGWYEVYYNGQSGWFRPEGLTFGGNCSFVPVASPTYTPTPEPMGTVPWKYYIMTAIPMQGFSVPTNAMPKAQTTVYGNPDKTSNITQVIDGGTLWLATALTTDFDSVKWVQLQVPNGDWIGWVELSQVTLSNIITTPTPTYTPEPPPGS